MLYKVCVFVLSFVPISWYYFIGADKLSIALKRGRYNPLPRVLRTVPQLQGRDAALPYKRPFVKYTPTWPRSFMPQNQAMRDLVAKMKLLPNEAFTRDARILFLDDSIVRGTQLKDNVVKLKECGVKEVHMRIACPPLVYPCVFLNFSSSRSNFDLFTRRVIRDLEGTSDLTEEILKPYTDPDSDKYKKMLEVMAQHLQLDSLKFQRLEDIVKAIGLPKEELCTHCWDNSSYM